VIDVFNVVAESAKVRLADVKEANIPLLSKEWRKHTNLARS
jgi:hypothetical protein